MSPTSITLADIGELLQPLAPIIFVVLYGIAHLVGNFQQGKRKAAPRQRPAQPPADFGGAPAGNAAPGNAGKQPTLEETLRREVEEFLRRAQGQPPQQQKQQPQRQQRPQQNRPAQRLRSPPQRNVQQPKPTPLRPEVTRRLAETRLPEPAAPLSPLSDTRPPLSQPPLGTGVALHTQTISQHAQSLGSDVAQADERMEEHLRQRFVHQLGSLAPTTADRPQAAAASSAAREFRELLARPGGMRQLIIANEILRRPDERWDRS